MALLALASRTRPRFMIDFATLTGACVYSLTERMSGAFSNRAAVAQALYEGVEYDENGQMLTGSMLDYAVPNAAQTPAYETAHTITPTPVNPLGVKGVGEAGTIAASAAVVNSVVDALAPLGIRHLDMPLKAERVWRAIQTARQAQGG